MQRLYPTSDGKDFIYLGYPLRLTPTEVRILGYITEHGTADVDALLAHCYAGREPNASNVSVRISSINQKARTIGGRRLLHLVQGRGYRLCDDI
ncbi:MAG: helix-turn-helix domain-containing protein [Clostridia bacterium]|nr:helix-turn-helix domain-containing protein [Clostridia bacterium]MBQ7380432.1 helix-turn-helix domain-containing protein [Clostridia bacterium]